jgi:hypothetical protein
MVSSGAIVRQPTSKGDWDAVRKKSPASTRLRVDPNQQILPPITCGHLSARNIPIESLRRRAFRNRHHYLRWCSGYGGLFKHKTPIGYVPTHAAGLTSRNVSYQSVHKSIIGASNRRDKSPFWDTFQESWRGEMFFQCDSSHADVLLVEIPRMVKIGNQPGLLGPPA